MHYFFSCISSLLSKDFISLFQKKRTFVEEKLIVLVCTFNLTIYWKEAEKKEEKQHKPFYIQKMFYWQTSPYFLFETTQTHTFPCHYMQRNCKFFLRISVCAISFQFIAKKKPFYTEFSQVELNRKMFNKCCVCMCVCKCVCMGKKKLKGDKKLKRKRLKVGDNIQ